MYAGNWSATKWNSSRISRIRFVADAFELPRENFFFSPAPSSFSPPRTISFREMSSENPPRSILNPRRTAIDSEWFAASSKRDSRNRPPTILDWFRCIPSSSRTTGNRRRALSRSSRTVLNRESFREDSPSFSTDSARTIVDSPRTVLDCRRRGASSRRSGSDALPTTLSSRRTAANDLQRAADSRCAAILFARSSAAGRSAGASIALTSGPVGPPASMRRRNRSCDGDRPWAGSSPHRKRRAVHAAEEEAEDRVQHPREEALLRRRRGRLGLRRLRRAHLQRPVAVDLLVEASSA